MTLLLNKIEQNLHKYRFICLSNFTISENAKPDTPDPSTNTQNADIEANWGFKSFKKFDSFKKKKNR